MRRIKRLFWNLIFIARNVFHFMRLKDISTTFIDENFFISGVPRKKIKEALSIYSYFNNSKYLDIVKYIAYFFVSKKSIFSIRDKMTNKIIGIELYYFNKKDILENTIHQGFRGVLPGWQGKGFGTQMTACAINHFKNSRLGGISSRVSLNNLPSLKSNINVGFRPVEKYFDINMDEERYYMICPFENIPNSG